MLRLFFYTSGLLSRYFTLLTCMFRLKLPDQFTSGEYLSRRIRRNRRKRNKFSDIPFGCLIRRRSCFATFQTFYWVERVALGSFLRIETTGGFIPPKVLYILRILREKNIPACRQQNNPITKKAPSRA